ncbi:MAG: anaerobic glycerol-3-phosphate dehydrogenase subunit C, partial [bacterium]
MQEIVQELNKRIQGEVRFDKYSRLLYSTDASIYEIEPLGVVIPKSTEDVQATVELAYKHGIPIILRGGGTSLVGQSIGAGIVIDVSKYLHGILEVNLEENWARIQPGVVLDRLNNHLRKYDLFFGPDVATSSRANLGGLIGNNSSGARSVLYGKTINHVLQLNVLLSNGEEMVLQALTPKELENKITETNDQSSIYATVTKIVSANNGEINKRYPKILRRVSGYNLDEFVNGQPFNLAKLIVGSEGTLAVVTEAKINLVPPPKNRVLGVLHFSDLFAALEAVSSILEFGPSAVELLDDIIIDLTRATLEYARRMTFIAGHPAALLLVEFQGSSKKESVEKLNHLVAYLNKEKMGYAHVKAIEDAQQENVWYIRKAGLGLLLGTKEDRMPTGFIEDTAVAPEKLSEYIRRFDEIIRAHQTHACFYAHASVGCLHIRPMLNLKSKEDLDRMAAIAEEVSNLALEYGGAMSGEHGDGLARSCWNEKMFGPQLYQAFRDIKKAFDPKNILNPGKIVDAQFLTENLRRPPVVRTHTIKPFFDYTKEGGFQKAIEICNGNGVCRKMDEGTMCPSYMVTMSEEHSTRGRANALRAVLTGKLDQKEFTSQRMYEILELCIACKGCKGECPTNVDMAKLKYEFLYHYHQANGLPLRDRFFGNIATINHLGCAMAPLSNWMINSLPLRWLLHVMLGIDRHRSLPTFSRESFSRWFKKHNNGNLNGAKKVVLFHDTFMTYNYPQIGRATVALLEAAGYEVLLPEKKCCGRPFLSKGMLEQARSCAKYNIEKLYPLVEQGYAIVGCEPSCILTFRDEYPDLLNDSRVQAVAENAFLIEEFLQTQKGLELSFKPAEKSFLLHGHCHSKALVGMEPTLNMLKMIPEAEVEVVDSGCCGMAGAFGFEKEHYQVSMAMGRRRLFEAVESKNDEWEIVTPGVSCRQQIEHGTGRHAKHAVEVLAAHLVTHTEP